jgi:hypothetical protein
MSQLLKAMGFWIWGLIAIGLSVALVSMNGRVLSLYRAHEIATATRATAPAQSHGAINGDSQIPSLQAPHPGLMISRVIASDMTAAQKALQAGQWSEALKYLEAARTKSGLTPFDEMSIDRFEGFANIKLNNLKAAQGSYERALATGAVSAADKTSMTRTLFTIAATTNQYQNTISYGEEMADAGTATPNDVAMIARSYYQMKDCKNSSIWSNGRRLGLHRNGSVAGRCGTACRGANSPGEGHERGAHQRPAKGAHQPPFNRVQNPGGGGQNEPGAIGRGGTRELDGQHNRQTR